MRLTYNNGCRCQACRDAAARYERGRQWDIIRGQRRHLPILGARRRLQALYALGWTYPDQAAYLGVSPALVQQWASTRQRVTRRTHALIVAMYDDLSMKLPPHETRQQRAKIAKALNHARRCGYLPPLAWDDDRIDDPDYKPITELDDATDVDENVVLRVLSGEKLPTNRAERVEILQRWVASGRSARTMERRMGWREGRYSGPTVGGEAHDQPTLKEVS